MQSLAEARASAGLPGIDTDLPWSDQQMAEWHLGSLGGMPGTFLEIRTLGGKRPMQVWHDGGHSAVDMAMQLKDQVDVYVGVQPRASRAGGKGALVAECWWMWVECDTPSAVFRALDYPTPPQMVVRSSPGKAHCYWPLARPVTTELLELGNKRLAWRMGGDMNATDSARILRVAGTRNHKYGTAERVAMTVFAESAPTLPSVLVGDLPDPVKARPLPAPRGRRSYGPDIDKDQLLAVPARVYIEALSGREVVRDMVQCPFHGHGQERTPSLHVGGDGQLWYCFGCSEGGDIVTFAAKLWGLDSHRDFPEVKRRLMGMRL